MHVMCMIFMIFILWIHEIDFFEVFCMFLSIITSFAICCHVFFNYFHISLKHILFDLQYISFASLVVLIC